MKRMFSLVLSVVMIITLVPTAFAFHPDLLSEEAEGIIGEIVFQDMIPYYGGAPNEQDASNFEIKVVVSAVDNLDGSRTFYEYHDDRLVEYHTTYSDNSGDRIESTYIGAGNSTSTEIRAIDVKDGKISLTESLNDVSGTQINSVNSSSGSVNDQSNISNPSSVRQLGYMHYLHPFTNNLFSISCEVIERYHANEEYTFDSNVGGQISFWLSVISTIIFKNVQFSVILANKVVQECITLGLLVHSFGVTYYGWGSRTLRCNWYEQEIHGTPTSPSGSGSQKYLCGVYAFLNYDGTYETETEGYTVADWGDPTMGHVMMYNVFGIDEAPTSWTNLDN